MNIKGTKSEENLKHAFAGESQARNKYTYYAEQAEREGHPESAKIFERMAKNELMHAKIWFKLLNPTVSNLDNIAQAACGEGYESETMYPNFAKQAREDGLEELALMFERVAEIEKSHELTFIKLLGTLLQESKLSNELSDSAKQKLAQQSKDEEQEDPKQYRCVFCGHESDERLTVCPFCKAIGAYQDNH